MTLIRPLRNQLWYSTLTVVGLALLAKLCGAFKEVVMAKELGTSYLVDQFVFAFSVATWPAALATSILTISLTPLLAKLKRRNDDATHAFMAQLWGGAVLGSLGLALLFGLSFPLLSPVSEAGGTRLAVMVGVVTFLSCMSALATVILMCRGNQIGTLLEGLPSLILGALLVVGIWGDDVTLIYGLILGMTLQLAMLCLTHYRHVGAVSLSLPQRSAQWSSLGTGLGYTSAGYSIMSSAPMIELAIASSFPEGSVASLGYAARVTALGAGLLATAVNRSAITHFCDVQSKRLTGPTTWMGILAAFSLVSFALSLVLMYFAPELVSLIFQRGRFDTQAALTVTHLMRWSVAQLGPYVATVVLCAYLSANGGFKQIFIACLVCFMGRLLCASWGSQHYGLDAIAAAPVAGHLAMFAYLLVAVSTRAIPSVFERSSLQT
jgi:putative peptidoglycan lipid II flippase